MRPIILIPLFLLLLQSCVHSPPEKQPKVVAAPAAKATLSVQPAKQSDTDCRQPLAKTEDQDKPLSAIASGEEHLTEEAIRVKRQYIQQIHNCWRVPPGTSGLKAEARVKLSNNGDVSSVIITSGGHSGFDASIEEAVRRAAPFKLPADEALRKRARNLTISFKSK
jgi:colicin import membrane protein